MAEGTVARAAALDILRRIRSGQRFEPALAAATDRLADSDRRLAYEISAGVLRSRTELDGRLRPLVSRKWDQTAADLKDLLRIGAYQLLNLERVPAHGAVLATVEVAKRVCGTRAAGFVNAVLRRVANAETAANNARTATDARSLADAYSHPAWLVERWVENFGVERTRALLEHNNQRPKLVIQAVRWSLEQLRDRFSYRGVPWSDAPYGEGLVVGDTRVEDLPGYHEGAFVVQDAAQAHLLRQARVPEGALVWDACASPGGKAAVLSQRGPVVASDINVNRIDRLRDTLNRVASDVRVLCADARTPPVASERVDVTLIDAPCSATGTLQRHPDGRWRLSEAMVRAAAEKQVELLNGARGAMHRGALLVYMTCSLEPEENSGLIDSFLASNPDIEREGADVFLFPTDSGTDGGFVSRLRRLP